MVKLQSKPSYSWTTQTPIARSLLFGSLLHGHHLRQLEVGVRATVILGVQVGQGSGLGPWLVLRLGRGYVLRTQYTGPYTGTPKGIALPQYDTQGSPRQPD